MNMYLFIYVCVYVMYMCVYGHLFMCVYECVGRSSYISWLFFDDAGNGNQV